MENNEEIKPFTTDGCSGGMSKIWRMIFKKPPPWEGCCVDHDKPYWKGGTKEERLLADIKLLCCVALAGYPTIAYIMFIAVRIGGHPLLPTPWRWGYGYNYPRYYDNK